MTVIGKSPRGKQESIGTPSGKRQKDCPLTR